MCRSIADVLDSEACLHLKRCSIFDTTCESLDLWNQGHACSRAFTAEKCASQKKTKRETFRLHDQIIVSGYNNAAPSAFQEETT